MRVVNMAMHTEEDIKKAIRKLFYKSGEWWFPYSGNEEEMNNPIESLWKDIKFELDKTNEVPQNTVKEILDKHPDIIVFTRATYEFNHAVCTCGNNIVVFNDYYLWTCSKCGKDCTQFVMEGK